MEGQLKTNKKFWKPPSFEDFNVAIPSKKIKLDLDDFVEETAPEELTCEPRGPNTATELAVHPKKIQEVRNWIREAVKEKAPVLILTGPAGSGKTTTLRVSASEEKVVIKEWINPVDKVEFKAESPLQNELFDKFNFLESKQVDKFNDFVFHSSRYKSLFEEEESTLILVEDIPNIFVWRPKQFHIFLEKYKNFGRSPIAFVLTDDQNLNLSTNLFPTHIKSKYNITNIKFNPINHSSLIKNLKVLSDNFCTEKVAQQLLENISKNSRGDIRSASNDLLFFIRTNGSSLTIPHKKTKKTKQNDGPWSLSQKDPPIDFYHIIGRILYPKVMTEKDRSECQNPNRTLLHDVQQIAGSWSSSFLGILHENYLQTLTKLNDAVREAECFSFCSVFGCNQELEEYMSLIGVITLMLSNTEPKKTGFNPIKRSFQFEGGNMESDADAKGPFCCHQLSKRDFLLDVTPFLKFMKGINVSYGQSSNVGSQVSENNESDEELAEIEEFDD